MKPAINNEEERVLVLAPTTADRELCQAILAEAGFDHHFCSTPAELAEELHANVGVILLTEDVLDTNAVLRLVDSIESQPHWSDVPVVMLSATGRNSASAAMTMERLGNVTILERPVRLTTLISAIRVALRARRRQYELRDQIEALEHSERQLRLVTDALPAVVTYVDRDSRFRFVNRALCDWFGLERESVIGRTAAEILGDEAYQIHSTQYGASVAR